MTNTQIKPEEVIEALNKQNNEFQFRITAIRTRIEELMTMLVDSKNKPIKMNQLIDALINDLSILLKDNYPAEKSYILEEMKKLKFQVQVMTASALMFKEQIENKKILTPSDILKRMK